MYIVSFYLDRSQESDTFWSCHPESKLFDTRPCHTMLASCWVALATSHRGCRGAFRTASRENGKVKADKKATVVDAARALLEVCDGAAAKDGQGYNGADSPVVRSICSQNFITPKQAELLKKILRKYAGQLKQLGFDVQKLEVPKTFTRLDGAVTPSWTPPPAPKVEAPPKSATPALSPWPLTAEELLKHFPPGYNPRPQQKIALEKIAAAYAAGKRVVALEMPTGGGKSLVCKAVANAAVARGGTHFLTSQRVLQDQYERDFPSPDIEILKGRSNYLCSHEDGQGNDCSDAPCTRQRKGILGECVDAKLTTLDAEASPLRLAVNLALKPEEHLCPYWKQLQKCHDHKITLFNFSSFLFQQRIGRFPKRHLMIIDEAHGTEGQLLNFVSLELTEWALFIVNVSITRDITSKEQFAEWLRETDLLRKIDAIIKDSAEGTLEDDLDQVQLEAVKELQGKIQVFLEYLEKTEWILEVVEYERRGEPSKKIVARPLFARHFAQGLLFRHAERVLCMSATILDVNVWAENLGLAPEEVELIQTPCDFPIENRPIFLTYAGSCSYKDLEATKPKLASEVVKILSKHAGQRGLIHTQSHALADFLASRVRSDRFLFASEFEGSKDEMLKAHAKRPDSVLVSPGMKEGVDLKGDLARFQILLKVPYPSLADKVVKERMSRDGRWYSWLCALAIVQSLGRIVRSSDDFGWSYILDSGFDGFLKRSGDLIPDWVKQAFSKSPPSAARRV